MNSRWKIGISQSQRHSHKDTAGTVKIMSNQLQKLSALFATLLLATL
jgi:hypothetical protein